MKEAKEMNRKQIVEYISENYKNDRIKFEFQENVLEMISENGISIYIQEVLVGIITLRVGTVVQ